MSSELYDYLFKIVVVGDSNCGKTSLLLRFTQNEFRDSVRNTVGVDLKIKLVTIADKRLKLTIWDTAGQERFRTLTSAYYRGAHGIILVYDITDRESFDHLTHWSKECDIYSTHDQAVKLLVANKSDLESHRQVTQEEGQQFARDNEMLFIEASSKSGEGVQQAFEELILKCLDTESLIDQDGKHHKQAATGGRVNVATGSQLDDRPNGGGSCAGFCA